MTRRRVHQLDDYLAPCGCVRGESVVGTCPECLPVGAITWLIENGRQLELFEEEGVGARMRGLESIEDSMHQSDVNDPEGSLPGLPF